MPSRHDSERFSDAALRRMFSELWAAIARAAVANPTFRVTERAGGVPPRPTGLTKVEGPGTITVAWQQVSIADLLYYEVQVSTDSSFVASVFTDQAGASGRYTYQGGLAGTTYFLRVRTVNGDGNASEWSATINSQTGQVTAAGINVTSLGAITTNLGSVELDAQGNIRAGQTAFNIGTGFFLGFSGGVFKFSIGDPGGAYMAWDGATLTISGAILNQTISSAYTVTLSPTGNFSGVRALGTHVLGTRLATPAGGTAPYTYLWSIISSSDGAGSIYLTGDTASDTIGFSAVVATLGETIQATVTCRVTDALSNVVYASFTVTVSEPS